MRGTIPTARRDHAPVQFTQLTSDGAPSQILWPVAPSGDGQGSLADAFTAEPMVAPNLGQLPRYSGDGHGRGVPMTQVAQLQGQAQAKSVRTPKGEAMKLAMLVVFFLLWISTASTLLFLYMDRYLFPG